MPSGAPKSMNHIDSILWRSPLIDDVGGTATEKISSMFPHVTLHELTMYESDPWKIHDDIPC